MSTIISFFRFSRFLMLYSSRRRFVLNCMVSDYILNLKSNRKISSLTFMNLDVYYRSLFHLNVQHVYRFLYLWNKGNNLIHGIFNTSFFSLLYFSCICLLHFYIFQLIIVRKMFTHKSITCQIFLIPKHYLFSLVLESLNLFL